MQSIKPSQCEESTSIGMSTINATAEKAMAAKRNMARTEVGDFFTSQHSNKGDARTANSNRERFAKHGLNAPVL